MARLTRGYYRNDRTGDEAFLPYRTRKVQHAEDSWTRIPKPKPKSRADRRDDVVSEIQKLKEHYSKVISALEAAGSDVSKRDELGQILSTLEISPSEMFDDIESLKDELENWRDNLPENLQDSEKANQLEDAINSLDSAIDSLQSVDFDQPTLSETDFESDVHDAIDTIQTAHDDLDEVISNLEDVEFPGMFG